MQTTFWLNNTLISTGVSPGTLLLDFVRKESLKGTKEGCKEGDCGACTVLVGELEAGHINYEAITSCLMPVGEAHGKHIVTIEGLRVNNLSPVQSAMVKFGGSQCGYCTPGFIMSMTWFFMTEKRPTVDSFKRAISGNLCRCTGYASIMRAGEQLIEILTQSPHKLLESKDRLQALVDLDFLPKYLPRIPQELEKIEELDRVQNPDLFVAGGTDLYVQQGEKIPAQSVEILNRIPGMKGYRVEDGQLILGALTSFESFGAIPQIRKLIPNIDDFLQLIASLQIRNRATLSGNIVNASPIGDMTQILLALGSTLTIEKGTKTRQVPLDEFFLDYKKIDLRQGELVKEISFSLDADTVFNFEKVSKRKELDIATVCSGARFKVDKSGIILEASISLGGVFATPLLLKKTNAYLVGKPIHTQTVLHGARVLQSEISPISDVRGSANYKRLLARQLYFGHFTSLFADRIEYRELLAS